LAKKLRFKIAIIQQLKNSARKFEPFFSNLQYRGFPLEPNNYFLSYLASNILLLVEGFQISLEGWGSN